MGPLHHVPGIHILAQLGGELPFRDVVEVEDEEDDKDHATDQAIGKENQTSTWNNQSVSQLINQSANQSINQLVNQSISKSIN